MNLGILLSKQPYSTEKLPFSNKCFYTGDKDSIVEECQGRIGKVFNENESLEKVKLNELALKVKNYLNSWDTQNLSPYMLQRENRMWQFFLCQERADNSRDISGGTKMLSFERIEGNAIYEIHLLGKTDNTIKSIFREVFDVNLEWNAKSIGEYEEKLNEEIAELKKQNVSPKENIIVKSETVIMGSVEGNQMRLMQPYPFRTLLNDHGKYIRKTSLAPRLVHLFAATPSIKKVTEVAVIGGWLMIYNILSDSSL